jgi:hypothetical protein
MIDKPIAILVRVRPAAKELLMRAAREQRRSQASLVEELIVSHLGQYSDVQDRLSAMINQSGYHYDTTSR